MFTRFEEQWHCCGGARLGGAMQRPWNFSPSERPVGAPSERERDLLGTRVA